MSYYCRNPGQRDSYCHSSGEGAETCSFCQNGCADNICISDPCSTFNESYLLGLMDNFKAIPIRYTSPIYSDYDGQRISARYWNGVFELDLEKIREGYNNHIWTNPRTLSDGSRYNPLEENFFQSFGEYLGYVFEHEACHSNHAQMYNETLAEFEMRIDSVCTFPKLFSYRESCVDVPNVSSVSCTDSDGGLDYYNKGFFESDVRSGEDFCRPDGKTLTEFYCEDSCSNGLCTIDYLCPSGCVDGACVKSTLNSCQEVLSLIESPTDLFVDGINYNLVSNSSYAYEDGRRVFYTHWSENNINSPDTNFVSLFISEMSEAISAKDVLNNALDRGLCRVDWVYMDDYSNSPQIVYICEDIWRLAQKNQVFSTDNPTNNYDWRSIMVFWFNDNLLFQFCFFSSTYYQPCSDRESCRELLESNHIIQQSDVISTMNNLLNNKHEYHSVSSLSYVQERFIKKFLSGCGSHVEDIGYGPGQGLWLCKMEPVICPPHGEQKQICIREDKKREVTIQCSPGICSGCMVPRWFGDDGLENRCVQYGFRFRQQFDSFQESYYREEGDLVSLTKFNQELEGYVTMEISDSVQNGYALLINVNTTRLANENFNYSLTLIPNSSSGGIDTYYATVGMREVISISDLAGKSVRNLTIGLRNLSLIDDEYYVDLVVGIDDVRNVQVYMNAYCDIDGTVRQQKTKPWESCQNNYECESNMCSYGECVDLKGIASELTGFKGFLTKVLCRLSNLFSTDNYNQCIANNI